MIFAMWDQVYFHIGPVPVDHLIVTQWALIVVITLIAAISTRKMQVVPKGMQNALEALIVWTYDFFTSLIDKESVAKKWAPLLSTLFIFIIISNYSGLIPGAAHVEGFQPPTSNYNVTAALALVTVFAVQIVGFSENGGRYVKRFINPINILEEITHPLSLTVRLFGNIFGEETILAYLLFMAPFFIPSALMGLSLLLGAIQALVFTILTASYLANASSEGH